MSAEEPSASTPEAAETTAPEGPVIEVHGPASAEDVAALVAVLSAAFGGGAGNGGERTPYRSTWASPARAMRRGHHFGQGAWGAGNRA